MSNLSINQLMAQLQNVPLLQQQVADAAGSDATSDQSATAAADGQDLPDAAAETAAAAPMEGASAPSLSPDMTAVLLQLQESQEMTDARSLLYGADPSTTDLFGDSGSDPSSDPSSATDALQAFLGQTAATGTSLMSTNQTLLDYLDGIDADGTGDTGINPSLV